MFETKLYISDNDVNEVYISNWRKKVLIYDKVNKVIREAKLCSKGANELITIVHDYVNKKAKKYGIPENKLTGFFHNIHEILSKRRFIDKILVLDLKIWLALNQYNMTRRQNVLRDRDILPFSTKFV